MASQFRWLNDRGRNNHQLAYNTGGELCVLRNSTSLIHARKRRAAPSHPGDLRKHLLQR